MQDLYQRPRSPFDDSALERLRRMGLADADGQADPDVMIVFARIFAGQFYDDLCDYYQSSETVQDSPSLGMVEVTIDGVCGEDEGSPPGR